MRRFSRSAALALVVLASVALTAADARPRVGRGWYGSYYSPVYYYAVPETTYYVEPAETYVAPQYSYYPEEATVYSPAVTTYVAPEVIVTPGYYYSRPYYGGYYRGYYGYRGGRGGRYWRR